MIGSADAIATGNIPTADDEKNGIESSIIYLDSYFSL